MRARRDFCGDLGKVQVLVASWHDEGRSLAVLRADCAENVSRGGALIVRRRGLVPRFAQRLVILFFWPMRASSANQISIVAGSTLFSHAISSRRAGKFFKILDSPIGLRMV